MPMGNGMGPNGMGSRTGRGAGYCNGFNAPGAYNRGGRGMGRGAGNYIGRGGRGGFQGGFGGGFAGRGGFGGGGYIPPQQLSSDEMLQDEAEFLEARLKAVREQLKDTEKDSE
ncbi:MAG TPA: hypothetical protein DCO79_05640 [Spirochaeta sp.]|nr:hypothetical protein [Spirochaeta sp.]